MSHLEHSNETRPLSRRGFLRRFAAGVSVVAFATVAELPKSVSASSYTRQTVAGVRSQGGSITVYSALNESTNNAFVEAFKTATPGIEVQLLPLAAAGELQTRIRTERNSPQADVFIGGSSEFHDPLGQEGLLETYVSANAASVDPAYLDPAGKWTGWYIGIFGLVINKDRWASEASTKAKPTTWDDLLDSDYQGKLILPDPVKTGGGYIFLATQVFRFERDEDSAMDYMRQLNANIGQYIGTSPQGIALVGQGQFLMGPNWGHDILTEANRGAPVEFVAPAQTANEIGAVSIVKGGPNTAGAMAFVDWVLTPAAAALNVRLSNRLSVLPQIPPAAGAPTLDQVNIVNYDRAWATDNKDRLLRKWQSTVNM